MYYSNKLHFSTEPSNSRYADTSAVATSVDIYKKFPFLSEEKYQKYLQIYYQKADPNTQLSSQTTYDLFSYLGLPQGIFTHLWSLCDINSSGHLSLPEFLLFVHFLDLYLSSSELPTTLPSNFYPEILIANREISETLTDSPRYNIPILTFSKRPIDKENPKEPVSLTSVSIQPQNQVEVSLSPSKEPPDDGSHFRGKYTSNVDKWVNLHLDSNPESMDPNEINLIQLEEEKSGTNKSDEVNSNNCTISKELHYLNTSEKEWEEIEQLKVKIRLLQTEIHSVEESQPDMNFEKLTADMIHLSEQRYQLESEFGNRNAEVIHLIIKARNVNDNLILAKMELLSMEESKQVGMFPFNRATNPSDPSPDELTQCVEAMSISLSSKPPMSLEVQSRLIAQKAKIESEKRRSDKGIELIERQVQRMSKRLERSEQFIHLYFNILMAKDSSIEGNGQYMNLFMEELRNPKRRTTMTKKPGAKPLSPIDATISVDIQSVFHKSQNSPKEKQKKILEEAQERLAERERHLKDDCSRLKQEKKNVDSRILRQEAEWKSIRHQALAQAQTTIANARAEMQAAREETASRANRNNRARLAEETHVIEKLTQEKIEATDRELHAIERLAKQKIEAACQEKENLEKKFRERMCQVETAIKKTEHEKKAIKNIYEGNQNICNSCI
ncbi:actin organization and endocytosis protein, partial [Basidiobolus ranarum]